MLSQARSAAFVTNSNSYLGVCSNVEEPLHLFANVAACFISAPRIQLVQRVSECLEDGGHVPLVGGKRFTPSLFVIEVSHVCHEVNLGNRPIFASPVLWRGVGSPR